MSPDPVRCLIADDHPALVAAVADYLEENGFEVVGRVADGASALKCIRDLKPDIALVDYRMPHLEGAELLARIREHAPDTLIAVYTAFGDDNLVNAVLAAGAHAIVLKDAPLTDLVRALKTISEGGRYVDPALARAAMGGPARSSTLTPRETEVLSLVAEGFSHEQIGQRLSISPETARTHVRKACKRLDARTRTHAVARALRLGLLR